MSDVKQVKADNWEIYSDVKQVKVDNWGIYFLQRLKHFFNRTDYCDLTLQFQDNAQLKVHRLVLSACTEYFELLERTCEMYEDCLVMPDDLQADVVVPIVNFMYTGHLEFKMDLLERLYQTSQILDMPVLTKLLESHRNLAPKPAHSYGSVKKFSKLNESKSMKTSTPANSTKRSYSKAFQSNVVYRDKKTYQPNTKCDNVNNSGYRPPSPISAEPYPSQKVTVADPRPTRYELPEELDTDNVFDNSFCNISYTSSPLMVHPDTVKRYKAKRSSVFSEASSSKKLSGLSTVDIVECKRISPKDDSSFDDSGAQNNFNDENDLFHPTFIESDKDPNQLFDQILDNDGNGGPKVTIETKDSKAASNLDHARIISEVLKKYPHLVKSNKNIKLKILDPVPGKGKKQQKQPTPPSYMEEKQIKMKQEVDDFTYETDVIDSKQAAKLIALGAENTKGPWICLICGTPGKALHFNSYYKFRRHLVEVHNEKPVSNICEYCGLRSLKRNYLMHHLYAQHGVSPPPQYHFPKCNMCTYIALTEGLLVKHKLTHKDIKNFRCNVCSAAFSSSSQLLIHIQNTGHKYSAEKKSNLQCIYCLKVFLRETNLYAHIKTHHKKEAKTDCIIEDSDEERHLEEKPKQKGTVKFEPSTSFDNEYEEMDIKYQIQPRPSSDNKQMVTRRQHNAIISNAKQKILNPGFGTPKPLVKAKPSKTNNQTPVHNDIFQDMPTEPMPNTQEDEIVVIDNNEYIMRDHQLIPRKRKSSREYILADIVEPATLQTIQQPTTSVDYTNVQNTNIEENVQQQSSMIIKKSANLNQPIQIVVSNEEEYKALMASNHPIIFDNGDSSKTLTVLSAPHHNTAIETTAIDLVDNTQSNEMMILPHDYPLNVTEAVSTENSNIVVVYSHPVDDPNKQFQILTTGGIGAQFVQSSAIITQNYETVTTSTPTMNAQCIETQVEQTWHNNIQTLEGDQIQLASHTVMQNVLDSNDGVTGQTHNETGDNLEELPEVNLVSGAPKPLAPGETIVTLNQSNVIIEQINQTVSNEINQPCNISDIQLIEQETSAITGNEADEALPQAKSMPDINTNHENVEEPMEIENVLEQPMVEENVIKHPPIIEHVMEQPMEIGNVLDPPTHTEDILEQPMGTKIIQEQQIATETVIEQPAGTEIVLDPSIVTENAAEQPIESEYVIEEPLITENVLEQPTEPVNIMEQPEEADNMIVQQTENVLEQPTETENSLKHLMELENVMEKPAQMENEIEHSVEKGTIIEQAMPTECITHPSPSTQNEIIQNQEQTPDINKYSNAPKNDSVEQPEIMESQAYNEIVDVNRTDEPEPAKVEKKIQNLTLEWSEDEYDVADDSSKTHLNEAIQCHRLTELPEVEESIENIQQEMQKQMAAQIEADGETAESAISSQTEEDSSSQDMILPPLRESPVPTVVQNEHVQEKLSSLLNDWEDNDSQEEITTPNENLEPASELSAKDANACSPEPLVEVTKNENIKSLVSDWDDDEEEVKE